jgi:hypothetical protein
LKSVRHSLVPHALGCLHMYTAHPFHTRFANHRFALNKLKLKRWERKVTYIFAKRAEQLAASLSSPNLHATGPLRMQASPSAASLGSSASASITSLRASPSTASIASVSVGR